MNKCIDCDKFNALSEENEKLLEKYNLLKIKYDRYDLMCWDCGLLGFVLGILTTFVLLYFLIRIT